jgi:hypothetical protein
MGVGGGVACDPTGVVLAPPPQFTTARAPSTTSSAGTSRSSCNFTQSHALADGNSVKPLKSVSSILGLGVQFAEHFRPLSSLTFDGLPRRENPL